jgi:hypothetical protein
VSARRSIDAGAFGVLRAAHGNKRGHLETEGTQPYDPPLTGSMTPTRRSNTVATMGLLVGYARVATDEQDLTTQTEGADGGTRDGSRRPWS